MDIKKTPKNAEKYFCELCDFKCCKQSDWSRHILRPKHLRIQNDIKKTPENATPYICSNCCKNYKYPAGLWRHKKTCISNEKSLLDENKELMNDNKDFKNLILELMKNNDNLQKQMLEVCKNGNTMINSNNNSHNKTFNMQFFLNEQCKDAMNITDFIDSFQLQFADLERVGEIGYVDGISDIIIKKLNEMDVYKRPIHCSDTKRDIMYVRAENVWEKETNSHDRLRLFIKQITHKNIKLIPLWAEIYPQAKDHEHPLNDNYLGMVSQAMGGRGNLEESENKIIKRIAKTVYIDKYQ
jgi:hypothetical protein